MSDNPWDDFAPSQAGAAPASGPWDDYAPSAQPMVRIVPSDAVLGQNGLMWNADGGYDPQTGELVVGGSPMGKTSQLVAGATGVLAGVPIVGPALVSGVQKAAGALAGGPQGQGEADAQDITNNSQAAYPKTTTAGNIVGGVASTLPLMAPIGAVADALGGGVAGNIAANVGAGAILSAGDTAAKGGSARDIAASGAVGGGLGAASVPVGAVLGAGGKYVGGKVADTLYGATHGAALPSQAADSLITSLGRQGDTPAAAIQTVQGMGPGATLADSGSGAQEAATRLAARDPNVGPEMTGNLRTRADQFGPRINSAVDAAAGPDVNAVQQMAQLKATTAANGAAAYGPIMNSGATIDVTPVRNAIAQARVDTAIAGTAETPISKALGQAQSYIVGKGPIANPSALPITVAHAAQDQIDDMASAALRAGNNSQARALWNVRNQLLQQMPPEYNAARAQYASDKAVENAFENGRSLLSPKVDGQVYDPDLLESRLATMSPPEQQAFQLGARKSLTDAMGQARTDAAGVKTLLANDNGYRVQKLQQVFGQQQIQPLLQELDHQATMQATNQQVYQGSKTALTTAADKNIPTAKAAPEFGGHGTGIIGGIIAGHDIGGIPGALAGAAVAPAWSKFVASPINAARQTAQDAQRMALAKALTSSPSPAIAAALNARAGQAGIPGAVSDQSKWLAKALTLGAAPTITSNGRKYVDSLRAP